MEAIRVGLVGYGYAGKTFHAPLIAACPGLELVAVSTSAPDKVRADFPLTAIEPSAEALFARADIELVVIPTPNETHYALASAALAAGKHVVVDKPFTVTLDEAMRLEAEAARAGKVLSVFHNRRWDSDFLTLRELLATGELGRVATFESHFDRFRPQVPVRWRESAASSGSGLWYDLGPHLIDQALVLFGVPQAIQLSLRTLRDGAEVDDYFHAILQYPRLEVLLHASTLTAQPGPRFAVHGTSASYIKHGLDTQEAALKEGRAPGNADWGADPNDGVLTRWPQGEPAARAVASRPGNYLAYYAQLAEAIHHGAPNPVPAGEAIRVMQLIEAGRHSAEQGCRIELAA